MKFDVIVIGAGAAGLMCAGQLGLAGRKTALIDHSEKLAEKIRISGGGRCNFTNKQVGVEHFVGENPSYASHALKHFSADDFIALVRDQGIRYHEKHKGQLFCDRSSEDIIQMLAGRCEQGRVDWFRPVQVSTVQPIDGLWVVETSKGRLAANAVVIATGGLPVPKIGASDFGIRIARQFGHRIVEPRPALVPLTFDARQWEPFSSLAGVSLPVRAKGSELRAPFFDEDLLFTHRGLSGPAILQISSYWNPGQSIALDLSGFGESAQVLLKEASCKDLSAKATALMQSAQGSRAQLDNWLSGCLPHWPKRLHETWLAQEQLSTMKSRKVAELGRKHWQSLADSFCDWRIQPAGTAGYAKAEVMRGGVSTESLSPRTMESGLQAGLYFIGEVVDVTGWLGGYNFQWAWSSATLAAHHIARKTA